MANPQREKEVGAGFELCFGLLQKKIRKEIFKNDHIKENVY